MCLLSIWRKGKGVLVLKGTLHQKGNSRMTIWAWNKAKTKKYPMSIKSPKARETFDDFVKQAKTQWRKPTIEGPVLLIAHIYYPDNRHDLDDSLLCDILQKAAVIKNDRQISQKILVRGLDKENPRVEVRIEERSYLDIKTSRGAVYIHTEKNP